MDKIAPEFDRVAHQYPKQIYSIFSLAGARDVTPDQTWRLLLQPRLGLGVNEIFLSKLHEAILEIGKRACLDRMSARPKHSLPRPPLMRDAVLIRQTASFDGNCKDIADAAFGLDDTR